MKLIAVNEIEYLNLKGDRALAAPGSPFEVSDETGTKLMKMGAAREPNEAEQALEALRESKAKTSRKSSGASSRRTPSTRARKAAPKKDGESKNGEQDDGDSDGGNGRDDDVV